MSESQEKSRETGLRFFGKINASISHEIRNVLAIINENTGLMKDLLAMANTGHPLNLDRLSVQVEKTLKQVQRANGIVDNMNRFAHSIDDPLKTIDVGECIEFVISLTERFASMKEVTLTYSPPSKHVEVLTSPFLLENIIFICMDYAMEVGKGKSIEMGIKQTLKDVEIIFSGLKGIAEHEDEICVTGEEKWLLDRLGGKTKIDKAAGSFILILPEKIRDQEDPASKSL